MSKLFRSRSTLNKKRLLKKTKENLELLPNKELDQLKLKINLLHSRNKSLPSKKTETIEDNLSFEKKIEKRFNKIDSNLNTINNSITGMKGEINKMNGTINKMNGTINEMKNSINDLFMLSILKENMPEEKDKDIIKKYISEKYKKLLPKLKNDPLSDIKNEDKNQNNIPKKNTNNIIKNNSSFVDKNNNNKKNIEKITPQRKKEYKSDLLNKKNTKVNKKYLKKSHNNKSSNSSNQNTISLESINKFSGTKSDKVDVGMKGKNNEKNMGENFEKKKLNIDNLLKKEIRIANIFESNTINNQTKNTEKKNVFKGKNNEFKQYTKNANMKNKKSSQTFKFKYTESMYNDSIGNKKNPFSGTYSKDSNSSSSKKNKNFVYFVI